jgi:hypothetical protein
MFLSSMTPKAKCRSQLLASVTLLVIRNRPKPTDTISGLRIRRWIWAAADLVIPITQP